MTRKSSTLRIADLPSPNHGPRKGGARVDMLVLHYTGMKTLDAALDRLRDPASAVSAHYLIARDGRVFRLVDESRRAWHAGVACWAGERDVNSRSIGVELENPGREFGYRAFSAQQMRALVALARGILKRHGIPAWRVLGHSDVAPRRKTDPGEKFPWRALARAGIGYWPRQSRANALPDIAATQRALAAIGYEIAVTGKSNAQTRAVVSAFQRHFRPRRVDGRMDKETSALAAALTRRAVGPT